MGSLDHIFDTSSAAIKGLFATISGSVDNIFGFFS
ncbi:hypothetical protein M2280_004743 [Prescottella agglutinans]|uniref:Uncharacterized protein n=1 Tax=Prescottella agglutinans TaxID=1644129 RepID=A0ABT6MGY1_9NOCA|nr:hypothetical protein [Prescottella agglutinans]